MPKEDGPETEHPDEIPEEEADDDETAELRALFPQGGDSPTTEEQWKEVFGS